MTPSAIPISSHSGSPVRSTTSQEIERLLVIAAVFLSPMTYLRTDIVFFTLSDLVASAAFVVMIANRRVPLRPFADMTSFWLFSVLLLCSGLIAGSLLNGDPLTGAVGVIQYVFSFVCIPLLLLGRPARETMFLCKVMAFSLVFVMLHGVLYSVFSPDDARFFSRNGRLTGLIERENGVGLLAGVGIVYVMWLYFISQISGIVFLALVAPVAYGLLLSASNSGFIVAVVGIFGISFFHGSAKHILAFIGIGALALAALFLFGQYFLPEVFQERVYGALTTGDSSEAGTFDGRLLLIQEAIYLIDRSIWLGVGVDQHRLISQYGAPVHNTYLLLFSEGGLVSLLGFVCLLLTLAFVGWRSFSNPDTRWSGVLMFTILLMFAVALNGVTHVYGRFLSVPLLLPAAICLSGYRVRRYRKREHR
ncbi:O-antigen ligase family protein [Roseibium aggregatum]|uniref:O-antigen ligase family protein n=1 Tax=Roseibium aggregatum TaxID=187304 RepID=UPI00094B6F69|nr:O-antigen ligase family protein [Roseibium aggregatum]UFI06585.1 O-antigen ligase family protein [Roseibium aggregatum]